MSVRYIRLNPSRELRDYLKHRGYPFGTKLEITLNGERFIVTYELLQVGKPRVPLYAR